MSNYTDKVKGGGGFSTEGKVTDYNFVEGYPFAEGSGEGQIYLVLDITPDGEDSETTQKAFWLGSGDYLLIEEDGKVLRSKGDDGEVDEERYPKLYDQGEVYKLVVALDELGFPVDSRFPDPEESKSIDFRGLIGTRVRFTEEKVLDDDGKVIMGKPKKKGKYKGKSFAVTQPVLTKILGLPEDKPKKGNGKADKPVKASTKTKAARVESDDEEEVSAGIDTKTADKFIKAYLKSVKGNEVLREKMVLGVSRYLSTQDTIDEDDGVALRKFVTSEEYLTEAAERGVISFDPTAKKQVVALA